jgi:hypothetical protein
MLTILCRCQELNQGFILYATALARAGLPVLRHRHAKVRFAAVEFVRSAIAVPHKAKWRGAGTDAIVDLIGYQVCWSCSSRRSKVCIGDSEHPFARLHVRWEREHVRTCL